MDVSLNRPAILMLRSHSSLLLLAEESAEGIFLRKVANMTRCLLEEYLKLTACNLPDTVNLLDELLQ